MTQVVGPLAVTSANRSGVQTPENAKEAAEQLGENLLVVDGGKCKGKPSTVINLLANETEILRLRRVLNGLASDGDNGSGAGLELLIDRLKTFPNNDEFLAEVAKGPSIESS